MIINNTPVRLSITLTLSLSLFDAKKKTCDARSGVRVFLGLCVACVRHIINKPICLASDRHSSSISKFRTEQHFIGIERLI